VIGKTARLFRNGRNQAVRIPREMEFMEGEVFVSRRGDEVILSARPRDWSGLLGSKAVASSGFLRGIRWAGYEGRMASPLSVFRFIPYEAFQDFGGAAGSCKSRFCFYPSNEDL
jgi:virulence-associated protein VagC